MSDLGPLYRIDVIPETSNIDATHRNVRLQAAGDSWADPSLLARYTRKELHDAFTWAAGVMDHAAVFLTARLLHEAKANDCDCMCCACGRRRSAYLGETPKDATARVFAHTPFVELLVPEGQQARWVEVFAETVHDLVTGNQRRTARPKHSRVIPNTTRQALPQGDNA
jgi:hypothetical protein